MLDEAIICKQALKTLWSPILIGSLSVVCRKQESMADLYTKAPATVLTRAF